MALWNLEGLGRTTTGETQYSPSTPMPKLMFPNEGEPSSDTGEEEKTMTATGGIQYSPSAPMPKLRPSGEIQYSSSAPMPKLKNTVGETKTATGEIQYSPSVPMPKLRISEDQQPFGVGEDGTMEVSDAPLTDPNVIDGIDKAKDSGDKVRDVDTDVLGRASEYSDAREGDEASMANVREAQEILRQAATGEGGFYDPILSLLGRQDAASAVEAKRINQQLAANPSLTEGEKNAAIARTMRDTQAIRSELASDVSKDVMSQMVGAAESLGVLALDTARFTEDQWQSDISNAYKEISLNVEKEVAAGNLDQESARLVLDHANDLISVAENNANRVLEEYIALSSDENEKERLAQLREDQEDKKRSAAENRIIDFIATQKELGIPLDEMLDSEGPYYPILESYAKKFADANGYDPEKYDTSTLISAYYESTPTYAEYDTATVQNSIMSGYTKEDGTPYESWSEFSKDHPEWGGAFSAINNLATMQITPKKTEDGWQFVDAAGEAVFTVTEDEDGNLSTRVIPPSPGDPQDTQDHDLSQDVLKTVTEHGIEPSSYTAIDFTDEFTAEFLEELIPPPEIVKTSEEVWEGAKYDILDRMWGIDYDLAAQLASLDQGMGQYAGQDKNPTFEDFKQIIEESGNKEAINFMNSSLQPDEPESADWNSQWDLVYLEFVDGIESADLYWAVHDSDKNIRDLSREEVVSLVEQHGNEAEKRLLYSVIGKETGETKDQAEFILNTYNSDITKLKAAEFSGDQFEIFYSSPLFEEYVSKGLINGENIDTFISGSDLSQPGAWGAVETIREVNPDILPDSMYRDYAKQAAMSWDTEVPESDDRWLDIPEAIYEAIVNHPENYSNVITSYGKKDESGFGTDSRVYFKNLDNKAPALVMVEGQLMRLDSQGVYTVPGNDDTTVYHLTSLKDNTKKIINANWSSNNFTEDIADAFTGS